MPFGIVLQPTVAGLSCAAIAVIAGAPMFSDGLRALRLARGFRRLSRTPLAESADGLRHVRGTLLLESPMFSPIAGTPCAGFRLEVQSPGSGFVIRPIERFRPFQLADGDSIARVTPDGARFDLTTGASRELKPDDTVSERLTDLLSAAPEVEWLRRGGATIVLTERVLRAGSTVHVVGTLHHGEAAAQVAETVLERTGTDDVAWTHEPPGLLSSSWMIHAGEQLQYLLVSDFEPTRARLRVSPLRIALVFVGPVLSLGGLLLLADAADRLRVFGG